MACRLSGKPEMDIEARIRAAKTRRGVDPDAADEVQRRQLEALSNADYTRLQAEISGLESLVLFATSLRDRRIARSYGVEPESVSYIDRIADQDGGY